MIMILNRFSNYYTLIRLNLNCKYDRTYLRWNSTKPNRLTLENNEKVEKILQQGKLPKDASELNVVVYEGELAASVKRLKWFSLTTTSLGLIMSPFLYMKAAESKKPSLAYVFCSWILILVSFSPLAINLLSKRYILKLEFNKFNQQFTSTNLNFFNREVKTKFKQTDVYVPKVPGLFTSFKIKNKPMFLDPAFVQDYQAYQHLLGHLKPINKKPN